MTEPQRRSAAILESWIGNAKPWTQAVRGGHIESRRAGTDDAILNAVCALGVNRVLDLGCGEGWLCRALRGQGMSVTGIDGSPALIRAAREFPGGDFHVCTYDELIANPLAFGDFDAVVCNFSLFDRDLQPLLFALNELLTPPGTLVIQTVHPDCALVGGVVDGWRQESFGPSDTSPFMPMPWYFRTESTWSDDLTTAGFTSMKPTAATHAQNGKLLSLILHADKSS